MRAARLLSISIATVAALTGAADASAATRYAAASGGSSSGACSSEDTACTIDHAIGAAGAGDTVVLLPGTYAVASPLAPSQALTIRGKGDAARPVLSGAVGLPGPTLDMSAGGTLARVALTSAAADPALVGKGVHVSDVEASATGSHAAEIKAGVASVVRDSLFQTTAGSSYAALSLKDNTNTGTLDVVNVTAVATAAGSTGIANGSGAAVTIVNTIAQGGQYDIWETVNVPDATVSYSSFRAGVSSGVNAGLGNVGPATFKPGSFRPETGSVTIDAGTSAVTLAPDLDGNVRGTAPDIGAYEYVAAGDDTTTPPDDTTTPTDDTTTPTDGTTTPPDGTTSPPGGTTTPPGGDTIAQPGAGDTSKPDGATGDDSAALPPAAPPVLGESVGLRPVRGAVTVKLPGASRAVPLREGASVPVGSLIDATRGTVALTSVRGHGGRLQTGEFWGGRFRVRQRSRGRAYTDLRLVGRVSGCKKRTAARGRVNAAGRRRRWSRRRLWGRDRGGRFRTRGRHGSATVRGTEWLTEDRCGGTFFRVKDGSIVVRDKVRRSNVTVKRGGRYLARAKRR